MDKDRRKKERLDLGWGFGGLSSTVVGVDVSLF